MINIFNQQLDGSYSYMWLVKTLTKLVNIFNICFNSVEDKITKYNASLSFLHQALRIMVYYGVGGSTVALLHTLACLVTLWRKKPKKAVRREINHPKGATLIPPHPTAPTSSLAYEPMHPSPIPRLEGNVRYCNVPDNWVQSENMVGLQQGPTAPQEDIVPSYARAIPSYWNPAEEDSDYRSLY